MKTISNGDKLTINEIFYSIQGESYQSGLPCIFIRLTGCDQRCKYCDTEYAFYEGNKTTFQKILAKIQIYPCKNVLITGGEPLLQTNTIALTQFLIKNNYDLSIETSGAHDISSLPKKVSVIMDLKTPASGENKRNNLDNISYLKAKDEVKFVVMDQDDIKWSLKLVGTKKLDTICHVSMSPVHYDLNPVIADKILQSGLKVRQQNQLHKVIWPKKERAC